MNSENDIDSIWKDDPSLIKSFLEQRDDYEQLCAEIAYILKKKLNGANIEFSSVICRSKTLKSFLEKIKRKDYVDPIKEITDFAGVRIVYLYQNDLSEIESIIEKEFYIIERVDKLNEKGTDRFGYGAIHFIVKIGKNSSGARYDDLKNFVCEIQVRTVLQDAWAIIDHHLAYKNESDIPSNLHRRLNSLAGLFETADNQFKNIRQERIAYLQKLSESTDTKEFLGNEINLDTFNTYLVWKFPSYEIEYFDGQSNVVYRNISKMNFKILKDIDRIIERQKHKSIQVEKEFRKKFGDQVFMNKEISSSLLVSILIGIDNNDYLNITNINSEYRELLQAMRNLKIK